MFGSTRRNEPRPRVCRQAPPRGSVLPGLKVAGEPGQQVIGFITADGVTQKVLGTLPLKVDYRASRTEFAFVLAEPRPHEVSLHPSDRGTDSRGGNPFSVHVAVDGQEWGYCTAPEGIKGSLERTGIAGWGVNAGGIGGMNTMEVAAVAR